MKKYKIKNLVFYKQNGIRVATVFYEDGSVENVSYEKALDLTHIIIEERKITSKNAFRELVNKEIIHVVTEEEYLKNYETYLGVPPIIEDKDISEVKEIPVTEEEEEENDFVIYYPEEEEPPVVEEIPRDINIVEVPPVISTFEDSKEEAHEDNKVDFEEPIYNFEAAAAESMKRHEKTKCSEKKSKKGIVKRIAAFVLALAIGAGIYSCASRKSKEGTMSNSNLPTITTTNPQNKEVKETNNNQYENYSYEELMKVTTNDHQRSTMNYLDATLINFNTRFANAYIEEGKDVRAALSFDEVVALQQAYSDYTPEQIKAYFNGTQTDSTKMTRNYKNATLQLMGAYVIETRENMVDTSWLIDSQEGRDFYYRYHNAFLEAKEATGTDKLMNINNFFTMVREDFPITQEVRTEGISHADSYEEIESYKLAVTPMIAAAEMMFQNLESDLTLNDSEIDFINDLGLCDYASKKFERIEMITLNAKEYKTNPTYEQFRTAIINNLKEKDSYVVNDARRDLSRLDAFQKAVNWHFEVVEGEFTGTISYGTVTTYSTVEGAISKPIPADKKAEIDAQIASENNNSRREGEEAAQRYQQQRQAEEDKKARQIVEEVEQDNANLQNQINAANDKINNNQQVNESDFNGTVTFDDNHKDGNGYLDDSVQNITTDPSGDMTNEPLPDPNAMGANFDKGQTFSIESERIIEYEEEYTTDEELVDAYIDALAASEYEGAYVYHK